ncbi:hypothetical protein ACQ86D_26470 [Streptomyces galilaeus]
MAAPVPAGVFLGVEDCLILDGFLVRLLIDLERRDGCAPSALRESAAVIHDVARRFRAEAQVRPRSRTSGTSTNADAALSVQPQMVTMHEGARLTGASESYLCRLARRGELGAVRAADGNTWLLDRGLLAIWAEHNRR